MLYGYIGRAITLVGIFAIPMGMSEFAKYAWFLICYTLLNAVFYTANNIAYSALTALVTKNSAERVEMGSYRFMFAFATSLAIQSVTALAVSTGRHRRSMAHRGYHLCHYRSDCQHALCFLRQGVAGGKSWSIPRIKPKSRKTKYSLVEGAQLLVSTNTT